MFCNIFRKFQKKYARDFGQITSADFKEHVYRNFVNEILTEVLNKILGKVRLISERFR